VNRGKWRTNQRDGDGLIVKLTRQCQRGDRVYFDVSPCVRVSGQLLEWESDSIAVISVDSDDVGIPQLKKHKHRKGTTVFNFPDVTRVMKVPVR